MKTITQGEKAQRMLSTIVLIVALIALTAWFWTDHKNLSGEVNKLNDEMDSLEHKATSYSDALEQANSNIEDAKSSTGSSYNEMRDALDSLETVEP